MKPCNVKSVFYRIEDENEYQLLCAHCAPTIPSCYAWWFVHAVEINVLLELASRCSIIEKRPNDRTYEFTAPGINPLTALWPAREKGSIWLRVKQWNSSYSRRTIELLLLYVVLLLFSGPITIGLRLRAWWLEAVLFRGRLQPRYE